MPNYRRAHVPGGTFFLTLVTENRAPLFRDDATRGLLRAAIADCRARRPFELDAGVLLLDHLHLLLTLPPNDADFSTRVAAIKAAFTRAYLAAGGRHQRDPGERTGGLDRIGVGEVFGTVVSAADVANGKPHPKPYLTAGRRLDVPPPPHSSSNTPSPVSARPRRPGRGALP